VNASSRLVVAVNIFAAPHEAFAAIKERPRFFLPLLITMVCAVVATWLYLAQVDIAWLIEQQLRAVRFLNMTDEQITQAASAAAARGRTFLLVQGIASTCIAIVIFQLLIALYLKIVVAIAKDGVSYHQLFGLVCWTGLPSTLASIATIVFLLTNDVSFLSQTAINPVSFGNLLGIDVEGANALVRIGANLGPINFWTIALMILGYRALSGRGIVFSSVVVLAPIVFVLGLIVALI